MKEKLKALGNFIADNKYTVAATVMSTAMTEAAMKNFRSKNIVAKVATVVGVSSGQVALMRAARKLDMKNK